MAEDMFDKAVRYAGEAVGELSMADKAAKMAMESGLPGAVHGEQDAFRHATWMAELSNAYNSKTIAMIAGTTHEFSNFAQHTLSRVQDMVGMEGGLSQVEYGKELRAIEMDLMNNYRGMQTYAEAGGNIQLARQKIRKMAEQGGLDVMLPAKPSMGGRPEK